jgi:hypothetical protein
MIPNHQLMLENINNNTNNNKIDLIADPENCLQNSPHHKKAK